MLLGLARGSGGRSLAGMRRAFDRYRRPLLDVSRADTVTACQVEGIEFWEDPHNSDPAFTRVRVRHPGAARSSRTSSGPASPPPWRAPPTSSARTPSCSTRSPRGVRRGARWPDGVDAARLADQPAGPRPPGPPAGRARRRRPARRAVPGARPRPGRAARSAAAAGRGPAARPRHRGPGRGPAHRSGRPLWNADAMDAADVPDDLVEVLFTEKQIQDRLSELAREIESDYEGRDAPDRRHPARRGDGDGRPGPQLRPARRDGLDGDLVLRLRHQVQRRRPDPQGPRHRHLRPRRDHRRRDHRHRPDPVVAHLATSPRATRRASRSARCCASPRRSPCPST